MTPSLEELKREIGLNPGDPLDLAGAERLYAEARKYQLVDPEGATKLLNHIARITDELRKADKVGETATAAETEKHEEPPSPAETEKQREMIAAAQTRKPQTTASLLGDPIRPPSKETRLDVAKLAGGAVPVTPLENVPQNTGGAVPAGDAHQHAAAAPPVSPPASSPGATAAPLGQPTQASQPQPAPAQASEPQMQIAWQSDKTGWRKPAKTDDSGNRFMRGLAGIGIGILGQQISRQAGGGALGAGLGNIFTKGVSGALGLPMMGGAGGRQRGADGRFLPGIAGILGSGGMGDILSGGGAGGAQGDNNAQLQQAIAKLTEAVETLTKVMQGQGKEETPGLDLKTGKFTPSFKAPTPGSADAVTDAALKGAQQGIGGSSSGDMMEQIQQILVRTAMAAAVAAL